MDALRPFNDYIYLYVEDDPLSRDVMKLIVENAMDAAHLIIFDDSHDFIARLGALSKRPDLILLDIHVQPLNGFEMLKLLRADERYRAVRVIALTASVMNEEVERLRASGFDGAIAKPLNVWSFPALVRRILNGESVWHITDD